MPNFNQSNSQLTVWPIIPMLLCAALLAACGDPEFPELQQGTLLPAAKPVADFHMTDHKGQPFSLKNLKDQWTLAFFGFTHCPDVCPTSMAMLAQVRRDLEKQGLSDELPQVIFVSVDPERDTPELLADFVPYFHPDFVGVSGDPGQTLTLTRQLGIIYGKAEGSGPDDYLIDHSMAIILFDPDGKFRAVFGAPHNPRLIAEDFLAISDYYEAIQ